MKNPFREMFNDTTRVFNPRLHDRGPTVSHEARETSLHTQIEEARQDTNPNTNACKLDREVSGIYSKAMKNRARIINGALLAGTIALFVMAFSSLNFFLILYASPETIAKIRHIKFGMSIWGSVCTFLNASCIFILCVEMKYAIEHYVKLNASKTFLAK